jgi:hypothetical protein
VGSTPPSQRGFPPGGNPIGGIQTGGIASYAVAISFTVERIDGLDPWLALTNPKTYDKAIRDGLVYAGRAAKTTLAKEVGSRFSLKAARIKDDIKGPTVNTAEGSITFRLNRRPPTAMAYGARQIGGGLSVAYKRGSRQVIPNAFVRKRRGGSVDLPFYRNEPGGRLNVLHGPSVGAIIKGEKAQFSKPIIDETSQRAFDQWIKGVERSIESAARRRAR